MQVISHLTIDLATPGLPPMLEGVQGDSARAVCLTLLENGKNWEIPNGAEVLVRYRNQNGQGGVFDTLPGGGLAYSFADNRLTLKLPAQVFGVPGLTKIQAVVLQGNVQVSVFSFQVLCEAACSGETAGQYTNLSAWLKEHGITPKKGVDYWTESDIQEMHSYIDARLGVIENGSY